MADLLIERTQNSSWVVTFKSLITIHHLMCYGNERFSQYMASHSSKFLLSNFIDKSGVTGIDMSSYIRKYAQYLNEKRETYKIMGFDFCKVKRGKEDGMLRTMNTDKLIKTLPILHVQLEKLLEFDIHENELTNSVITACFILLSKDLIRLYACYNDGIINLLEKYFEMNKKNCKDALDIYRKFLNKTDTVSGFLKVAESAGMEKGDIPDLTKAPSSLLDALEAHLNTLENKKTTSTKNVSQAATSSTVSTNSSLPASVSSAINSLNSNTSLSQEEKRRIIEEEARTLEALKSQNLKKQPSFPGSNEDSLFSTTNTDITSNNMFNNITNGSNTQTSKSTKPSDDLLFLDNTFTSNPFQSAPTSAQTTSTNNNIFPSLNPINSTFDILQPISTNSTTTTSNTNLFDIQSTTQTQTTLPSKTSFDKLISNDIDSSLASLADNLDINYKNNLFNSNKHNWSATQQQTQVKTGGANWKPMTSTTSPTHQIASTPLMMQPPMNMMQPQMMMQQAPLMQTTNPMLWPNTNGNMMMPSTVMAPPMMQMQPNLNNPFASIIQPQQANTTQNQFQSNTQPNFNSANPFF